MAPKIVITGPGAEFAQGATEVVHAAYARSIEARGRFVVALTGGSTPKPIHEAMAADARFDWSKVHVTFGDERAVAPDDKRSNYGAAKASLIDRAKVPPANVLRMEGESNDLHGAARDYEARLDALCGAEIDLVFVGVGGNAHIFSLFPGAPAIDEGSRRVIAELDPPMDPAVSRITFTPAMIDRARALLVVAAGKEKVDAVTKGLEGRADPKTIPVHLTRRGRDVTWVVDRDAAAGLRAT